MRVGLWCGLAVLLTAGPAWAGEPGVRVLEGHSAPPRNPPGPPLTRILALAFSPDCKWLASAGVDGTVRLWDVASGECRHVLRGLGEQAHAVAFAPDGKTFAAAGEASFVRVWLAATGEVVRDLKGHEGTVAALEYSPDGKLLATGGYDRTIRLWDSGTGKEVVKLTGHEGRVTGLSFSPDGRTLASGGAGIEKTQWLSLSQSDNVWLWDVATRKPLRTLQARGDLVTFSPDGRTLGVAAKQLNIISRGEDAIGDIKVGRGDEAVVIGGYTQVSLVDLLTGDEFWAEKERGRFVVFSPDGASFVTGQGNGDTIVGAGAQIPLTWTRR